MKLRKNLNVFLLSSFSFLLSFFPITLQADISINPNANISRVKKIAMIPYSNDALGHRHTGEWETILIGNGYQLIERANMEDILKEQKLSITGIINPNQAAKLGELLGVDGIVLGKESRQKPFMGETSNGLNLVTVLMEPSPSSVKLIDTKTGQVIWQFTPKKESEASAVVNPGLVEDYSKKLKKQLKKYNWNFLPDSDYQKSDTDRFLGISEASTLTSVSFSPYLKHIRGCRIAVYPFKVDAQADSSENLNGDTLADEIGNSLISAGYDVIERSQLETILKEQHMTLTGAIRQEDMAKLGEIVGIKGIVFGAGYGQPDKYGYSAKLVDVESGELYWSAYGAVSFNTFSELVKSFLERHGMNESSK